MTKKKKHQKQSQGRNKPTTEIQKKNWFTRNSYIFLAFSLIVITYLVYSNSIKSEFVLLDDTAKVQENTLITGLSWENIKAMFDTFIFHTYFPVTLLSYAFDYNIWGGLEPHGFHTTNLMLHILNVLLLFIFVKKFTGKNNAAFIASLIFAVHPMNVETVAWLSERSNLLYTLFFLASMISYLKLSRSGNKIKYHIPTYLFFLLSLLSKSSAVILPLVFILIDYFYQNKFSLKIVYNKIPYLLISLVFGLIAIYASVSTENIKNISATYTIFDRIFLAFYPLVYYVVKFFAPIKLSVIHPYPLKSGGFLPFLYYLSLLPILVFIFVTVRFKPLKQILVFAFSFFFLNISVLLMIVPIGGNFLMAEHFVYVPFIGFAIAAGIIFSKIHDKSLKSKIPSFGLLSIYFLLIPLFCLATYNRNPVWKNSSALFTDLSENCPDNSFAHYGMGTIYIDEKNFAAAISELSISIQFDSTYADAYYNRAIAEINLSLKDSALADLDKTILLNPSYNMAYVNRGNLRAKEGDTTGAINDFDKAIEINKDNAFAYYDRGNLKMNIKKYEEAIDDFDRALSLNPNYTEAYNNRGITKYYMKNFKGSIEDYNTAILLDEKNANTYKNRGLSELAMADSTAACEDFYNAYDLGLKTVARLINKNCK
jgi:protein O-mannosyl-transferase